MNYRTTLAGAINVFGTGLLAVGIVPQLAGAPKMVLVYVALAGFVIKAFAEAMAHYYAADAACVAELRTQVDLNTAALKSRDTSILIKKDVPIKNENGLSSGPT